MSSEERELPASQQKLRRARERGEVARSADLNAAAVLISMILYLMARLGSTLSELQRLWSLPLDFRDGARGEALRLMANGLIEVAMGFLGPLLLTVVVAAVFAELVMKRGIVLSFEPALPKFERVNPVSGFMNLFSLKRLVELVKSLFKLALLGAGGAFVLLGALNALMWLPRCGIDCIPAIWEKTALGLSGLAIAIFIVNALLDMRLQSWLFLRDQRMTKTEKKQEAKNTTQSPEMRRAIRQQARQDGSDRRTAMTQASLVIGDRGLAIAIRYVEGDMPAPVCVAKAKGAGARRLIVDADRCGVPVHGDIAFVATFFDEIQQMGFMPTACYGLLAQILKEHKLL